MEREAQRVLDEWLVLSARGGSATALRALIDRWTPRLRRHAERLMLDTDLAGDVVQESWLAIARGLPRLSDPAMFPGWSLSIVSRKAADAIRRRQRDRRAAALADSDAPSDGGLDRKLDVQAAIARLPVELRLLVSLFYGEGQSVDAIARTHGLAVGTVKSRLHAARLALRTHLEGAVT